MVNSRNLPENLHTHTLTSDGELSYKECLSVADNLGIGVIAFTDHDSLPTEVQVQRFSNSNNACDWICGIEISSGLPVELGGGSVGSFHILGLFVDITNKNIKHHCELAQQARVVRMKKMVDNLRQIGFKILYEDCLSFAGEGSVGRPHIVKAIQKHSENNKVVECIFQKMQKDSKSDQKLRDKIKRIRSKGLDYSYYDLFLSKDSYINDVYQSYEYYLDMDSNVSLIRDAGGVAILAHYHTISDEINGSLLEAIFRDRRLDGAEVVFEMEHYSEENVETARDSIRNVVNKYGGLQTGGGDIHTRKQFDLFAASDWFNFQTIGMTEKVINRSKVDLTWSSFSN